MSYLIPILKRKTGIRLLILLMPMLLTLFASEAKEIEITDWKFHQGDVPGAETPDFNDEEWEQVTVPHDWSIGGVPCQDNLSDGGNGFFPMGIGWYRTQFEYDSSWESRCVDLVFDGVYRNAEVWINGDLLGRNINGYTSFRYNLSSHLKTGGRNTLAVKVDNSLQPNSRWYSGSGIYRPVWLEVDGRVRTVPDSLFVYTKHLELDAAELAAQGFIENLTDLPFKGNILFQVIDQDEVVVSECEEVVEIEANSKTKFDTALCIQKPLLWSPDCPHLYTLRLSLIPVTGEVSSRSEISFGVRILTLSAEKGLQLNGKLIKLYGGNVHHDHGPIGTASYLEAEARKVRQLKEAGFNAVRTSHNPPASTFLDECDRQGLLVIEEAFDGWKTSKLEHDYSEVFDECWASDIEAMVCRDRNHPSVIMWSTGNEVFERKTAEGLRRGHQIAAEIRTHDRTRPVTIGLNGMGDAGDWTFLDGMFAAFEAAGYNYELVRFEEDHVRLPNRVMYASESFQNEAYKNWEIMTSVPYVIGDFVWSAIDYLGEAGIGKVFDPGETVVPHWEGSHFPWHGAYCGDIDITGWRKPISHYRQIVWDRGETLYAAVLTPSPNGEPWSLSQWSVEPMLPVWDWPGHEGELLTLRVFSRHEKVRIYRNGKLLGVRPTTIDHEFMTDFSIEYQPGVLTIVGVDNGKTVEFFELETPGLAYELQLTKEEHGAGSESLIFVEVEVVDNKGRWLAHESPLIQYELTGPAVIMGIGSGDLRSEEGYQQNPRHAHQGRTLVVIRTLGVPGEIELIASADGLKSAVYRQSLN